MKPVCQTCKKNGHKGKTCKFVFKKFSSTETRNDMVLDRSSTHGGKVFFRFGRDTVKIHLDLKGYRKMKQEQEFQEEAAKTLVVRKMTPEEMQKFNLITEAL